MTEFTYSKLRGRIREKYGSESRFAEAVNITTVTMSRKLNGKTQFSADDIKEWCDKLDISIEEIGLYFFA